MSIIIGVTGLARAGKDTMADYLVRKYNFKKFNMSDVISLELMKRGKQVTKENMSLLGDQMRKEFGNDIIIIKTLEKCKNFDNTIITGFRSPEEVSEMRYRSNNFFLFSINAEKEIRFSRRTDIDPQTESEFFERDTRDIDNKGLGRVIESADISIDNNSTFEKLDEQIDKNLKHILNQI
ncbi:MAG: AAA family ATPase [DPANN group archaeon]|nr:AAA family ATPase [DPANN group archaeon]